MRLPHRVADAMACRRRLRLVAITDRHRMVPGELLATGDWAAIAGAFSRAIAPVVADDVVIQVREKDLDGGPLLVLVRAALATGARVIVNDRVDVALAAGAHGVHLPERGVPIADARMLAAGLAIGVSCHTVDGVRAAATAGADLIQLGPIWRTPGKGAPLGTAALAGARAALASARTATDRPRLVAVGGVETTAQLEAARGAGADAVAAIRAVWAGALRVAIR
jgi:thiamine-phosphate pyrophosphorylase